MKRLNAKQANKFNKFHKACGEVSACGSAGGGAV